MHETVTRRAIARLDRTVTALEAKLAKVSQAVQDHLDHVAAGPPNDKQGDTTDE